MLKVYNDIEEYMMNELNESFDKGFDEGFCIGTDVGEHRKTPNFDGATTISEPPLITLLHRK